jgi:plastocyanin
MRRSLIALVLTTALFAGCGGDDEEQPAATPEPAAEATEEPAAEGGGGQTVEVSSPEDGALKFDQAELSAKAGKVTFNYANPSQVPHALEIEGNGVEEATDTIQADEASVTVDLEAGTYRFYCPVGQHADAGMEGELTVE